MTSAITTHVLDTGLGAPAAGVPVRLERLSRPPGPGAVLAERVPVLTDASEPVTVLAEATTDADGRVPELGPERVEAGAYRLVFDTATYFAASRQACFFPQVSIVFALADPAQHHHVPLLLSPFAYSTYRGS